VTGELFVGVEDSRNAGIQFTTGIEICLAVQFSIVGLRWIEQDPRECFIEPFVPVERLECIGERESASMSLPVFSEDECERRGLA
jgi:hypothetical protein